MCIGIKTKFQTCAFFHVSVNEEDFPSINSMGVWPNGSSIAPLYGRRNQIYSLEVPDTPVAVAPASPRGSGKICRNLKGDDDGA
jgi:hypothetical protein